MNNEPKIVKLSYQYTIIVVVFFELSFFFRNIDYCYVLFVVGYLNQFVNNSLCSMS